MSDRPGRVGHAGEAAHAVAAEVRAAFDDYERALVANDLDRLDQAFAEDDGLVRFGIADHQVGSDAVAHWRGEAPPIPKDRRVGPVWVTVTGPDTAVVACEFRSSGTPGVGRQSQVWVRQADRWRIAHAHVSVVDQH